MERICPKCGAKGSERAFIGSFCTECFKDRASFEIPLEIHLDVCKNCGRAKVSGKWVELCQENLTHFVLLHCKIKSDNIHVRMRGPSECLITILVESEKKFVEVVRKTNIKFVETICPDCSRKSGGYYEGIIQLRGDAERVEKLAAKIENIMGNEIVRTTSLKEGLDLYFFSHKNALVVLGKLGLKFTQSPKLFGVKDGERVYRTTICVRV